MTITTLRKGVAGLIAALTLVGAAACSANPMTMLQSDPTEPPTDKVLTNTAAWEENYYSRFKDKSSKDIPRKVAEADQQVSGMLGKDKIEIEPTVDAVTEKDANSGKSTGKYGVKVKWTNGDAAANFLDRIAWLVMQDDEKADESATEQNIGKDFYGYVVTNDNYKTYSEETETGATSEFEILLSPSTFDAKKPFKVIVVPAEALHELQKQQTDDRNIDTTKYGSVVAQLDPTQAGGKTTIYTSISSNPYMAADEKDRHDGEGTIDDFDVTIAEARKTTRTVSAAPAEDMFSTATKDIPVNEFDVTWTNNSKKAVSFDDVLTLTALDGKSLPDTSTGVTVVRASDCAGWYVSCDAMTARDVAAGQSQTFTVYLKSSDDKYVVVGKRAKTGDGTIDGYLRWPVVYRQTSW
ncbi:hypothetical protein G1C96_1336 [Bifidobacterium sp. DSM 109958]|uniref:Lipoprotein n=1 Tax=Bifidobacterium moraviense TaxID=2675323 RepID=A0A7Y0HYU3_9BIFI|nr:hypothetical protein [Bifidobacterium sp. DSM 109958]NMN00757.1 hypothetical protein [Bifidobacterium sp. DSM 109958]